MEVCFLYILCIGDRSLQIVLKLNETYHVLVQLVLVGDNLHEHGSFSFLCSTCTMQKESAVLYRYR